MKQLLYYLMIVFFPVNGFSQEAVNPVNAGIEQQLELLAETNPDVETEDDSYLQELHQFEENPVDINTANEFELSALKMLSPVQVRALLLYREKLGKLVSIYELQAIPGWDISLVQKIRLYVTVSTKLPLKELLSVRLKDGRHNMMIRISQLFERSGGNSLESDPSSAGFAGSPQKIFMRYKYQYKNLLQYGIAGEKDAGEAFFRRSQRYGFDHYTFHFFVRNAGLVRSLALGDFTINMGQGLVQWMGFAFKKSAELLSMKRQGEVIKPYNGAGEYSFHRGAGVTLAHKAWESSTFISLRYLDASFQNGDSINASFVSSLQTSGLHRTAKENYDKGRQRQLAVGANLRYRSGNLAAGINFLSYRFHWPIIKDPAPYNLYALHGKSWMNYSFDYGYTYRNLHVFGEAAKSTGQGIALSGAVLASLSANTDVGLFYRNISSSYQALYTNAFTENTSPSNEKGFFAGMSLRPAGGWRVDMYADIYSFPWLKYRVNAPGGGADYLLQITWKPNKVIEMYSRLRSEAKPLNDTDGEEVIVSENQKSIKRWRTHLSYKITSAVTVRCRTELSWYDRRGYDRSEGYLLCTDVLYKKPMNALSGNIRLAYFETTDYNSRLYAFENDVLYSSSVPALYGKGWRWYVNSSYKLSKRLIVWVKIAGTVYKKSVIQPIPTIRDRKEVKIQTSYIF